MVIWSDIRGATAQAADPIFKELMAEYEGQLRWAHRAVPNSSRPDEAKRIHQFARAVFEGPDGTKKFWQARDLLLAIPDSETIGDAQLRPIAKQLGMDFDKMASSFQDSKLIDTLVFDMSMSTRFGVNRLPAVFINGRPMPAFDSPAQLKKNAKELIDAELSHAKQALARGTTKNELYDTLVKDGLWSLDDDPANRKVATKPVRFSDKPSSDPVKF
jgi:protein-disulfide isomerase